MHPRNIKTIRQLIYWEYAKLIAGGAVDDRCNYWFVMYSSKRLEQGRLHPSSILCENNCWSIQRSRSPSVAPRESFSGSTSSSHVVEVLLVPSTMYN